MASSKKSHRILVVNSDLADRNVAASMMRFEGYQVLEAATVQQSLKLAEAAPDLIILAVNVADCDGVEACQDFRDNPSTATVPIVGLSDQPIGPVDKIKFLELGVLAFVSPSTEPAILVATVKAFLGARRTQQDFETERLSQVKDEFLAVASHKMRSLLTGVLGWSELLMQKTLEDDVTHGLDVIMRNTKLQANLINDLSDIFSITSGKLTLELEVIDLKLIVESSMKVIAQSAAAKNLSLFSELYSPGPVMADQERINKVLVKLLTNAVRFTPSGGTIQITLRAEEGHAEINISDNGCGIAPELLPQILNQYGEERGSIKRTYTDQGIGLELCKQLVAMHGGALTVHSMGLNKGTSFKIRLPSYLRNPSDST